MESSSRDSAREEEQEQDSGLGMAPAVVPFLPTLAEEKTLNASFIRDEDERPKVPYNQFSNDIPVISLAGIDEEDKGVGSTRRAELCRKIVEACEEWGIFQVVDHGVDSGLIADMTRLSKEFFALSPEEKLQFDMSGGKKGGFIVSSHLQVKSEATVFQFSFSGGREWRLH